MRDMFNNNAPRPATPKAPPRKVPPDPQRKVCPRCGQPRTKNHKCQGST